METSDDLKPKSKPKQVKADGSKPKPKPKAKSNEKPKPKPQSKPKPKPKPKAKSLEDGGQKEPSNTQAAKPKDEAKTSDEKKDSKSKSSTNAKPKAKPASKTSNAKNKNTGKDKGKDKGKTNGSVKPQAKSSNKNSSNGDKNGGSSKSKPNKKSPTPSGTDKKKPADKPAEKENEGEEVLSKIKQLKNLINISDPPKLKFDNINEYFEYYTYNLFLEELFDTEICPEIELEWDDEDDECTLKANMDTLFKYYVPEEMRHLKKHPFTTDQPIFILRKSQINLDQKPDIWFTYVSNRTIMARGKGGKLKKKFVKNAKSTKSGEKSFINLTKFEWSKPLPYKENGKNFAILPANQITTRIMMSMNNLSNPFFKNLLLGQTPIKVIKFQNKLNFTTSLNDSQMDAIQRSLNNRVTILKGPPGSGKTSTIYELIMQLLDQFNSYPILVIAASNLAVDNIAEKLMKNHEKDLLRITSITKESEYPTTHPLGSICLHNKISNLMSTNAKDIQRRMRFDRSKVSSSEFNKFIEEQMTIGQSLVNNSRVILSTTVGIGGPYLKKLKDLPVIIMDESTQSSEPISLIPLAANNCKRIIFVGDEKQLSSFTNVPNLEMSLFERLLKNGNYQNPCMLNIQYRMHPKISNFPRNQFYDGQLLDGVTEEQRSIENCPPMFFLDHQSQKESRKITKQGEEYGLSWVNYGEITQVERMIERLIIEKGISRSDIGVMTGYSAQRMMISQALENNLVINPDHSKMKQKIDKDDFNGKQSSIGTTCYINDIIVSTVDAFQGREKKIVIFSCVRSNDRNEVGFLKDYRRMNVAFTRAQNSFIIIGDSKTLSEGDPMWKNYILSLKEMGAVKTDVNEY